MRWIDLLFMHWPVAPATLSALLPKGLVLDTFDGRGWLGVIPFEMRGVRPRGLPAVPGTSRFLELNVRTYARLADRPEITGVWFFSLDASNPLAVTVARRAFHLNYLRARMALERHPDGTIAYRSRRTHRGAGQAELDVSYRPVGDAMPPGSDALADFLTSRYRLFADTPRGIRVGDIDHPPWRLRPAEAELRLNTMAAPLGVTLPGLDAAVLHHADPLDVRAWTLATAERSEASRRVS